MKWIKAWGQWIIGLTVFMMADQAWGLGCSVTVVGVNFGVYAPNLNAPGDSTGNIDSRCDVGIAYAIHLDSGGNPLGDFVPRNLRQTVGTGILRYNLYRNSARTQVWGDGTSITRIQQGMGTGQTTRWIIYGRIPGRQNVPAGVYADTVRVTVLW